MFFLMFVPFNDPSDVFCEAPAKLSDVLFDVEVPSKLPSKVVNVLWSSFIFILVISFIKKTSDGNANNAKLGFTLLHGEPS